jgi:hypothetical protein
MALDELTRAFPGNDDGDATFRAGVKENVRDRQATSHPPGRLSGSYVQSALLVQQRFSRYFLLERKKRLARQFKIEAPAICLLQSPRRVSLGWKNEA